MNNIQSNIRLSIDHKTNQNLAMVSVITKRSKNDIILEAIKKDLTERAKTDAKIRALVEYQNTVESTVIDE